MGSPPRPLSARPTVRATERATRTRDRRRALAAVALLAVLPVLGTACTSHKTAVRAAPSRSPVPLATPTGGAGVDAAPGNPTPAKLPPLSRKPVPRAAVQQASKADVPTKVAPKASVAPAVAKALAIPTCPLSGYAKPDDARPDVALTFDLSADHRTVTGTESVTFTPDKPVTELVFRLWPNGPEGGRRYASMTVSSATSPNALPFRTTSDGARAGTQGTLLSIPLGRTAPAHQPVTADLAFTLRLPPVTWDRYGTDGHTSYWGSGHPLLAWQRGVGWNRDPASPLPGETQTSEVAKTSVAVTAPASDTVLAPGDAAAPIPIDGGRKLWRFTAPAIRDVAVVAGPLKTASTTIRAAGTTTTVVAAVAPGLPTMSTKLLLDEARRALPALADRFGPMPYGTIRIVAVPGLVASGIEYPGMAWVLPQPDRDSNRVVETHELAHQWFYAMVGNDQATSPWLDEAFATYAESLVDDNAQAYFAPVGADQVGRSMASFGQNYDLYQAVVYGAGTTALHAARAAAGAPAFDAAIRCYVRTEAWSVATPADLATQLKVVPAALAVLRRAGAVH
jgi:hypothetical protein